MKKYFYWLITLGFLAHILGADVPSEREVMSGSVSLSASAITVKDALSKVLENSMVASWGIDGPDVFQNIRIGIRVENITREDAINTILKLGGGKYRKEWNPVEGSLEFKISPEARKSQEADFEKMESESAAIRSAIGDEVKRDGKRAMVFLLDFDMSQTGEAMFQISPYSGRYSKILKSKTLEGDDLEKLLETIDATLKVKENSFGAMCHFPIHGVRVFDKRNAVIFESSFCWHCGNYFVRFPDGFGWVSIPDSGLYELLNKLMPVPKEETERFEKKYGGKKK